MGTVVEYCELRGKVQSKLQSPMVAMYPKACPYAPDDHRCSTCTPTEPPGRHPQPQARHPVRLRPCNSERIRGLMGECQHGSITRRATGLDLLIEPGEDGLALLHRARSPMPGVGAWLGGFGDRDTGRSRGFGFVTYTDADSAQAAMRPWTEPCSMVAPSRSTRPSSGPTTGIGAGATAGRKLLR